MELTSHLLFLYLGMTQYLILIVNCLFNAALYRPAWQNSVYYGGYPYIANDGSRRNYFNAPVKIYECQHTLTDYPAWWMVDLQGQYVIEQVIVTNRNSSYETILHRLRAFQIDVFSTDPRQRGDFLNISGDVCYNRTAPVDGGTYTWNCTTPVVGRFVRLIKYSLEALHICEMEVMVSKFFQRFTSFTAYLDSGLNKAFIQFSASTSRQCVNQCLAYTSGSRCTAFNWNRNTSQCQLLSIDTRISENVTTQLQSISGTDFYMEAHNL